ncbi:unnamed protein product [Taenia asiatica]|uniref:Secreted protein n=1 Tax=Taenia asiatica TaxID=60517 RepID=A0A0R3VWZ3_TAEAS|nr:unnamed protein product [Taenia asiatica]
MFKIEHFYFTFVIALSWILKSDRFGGGLMLTVHLWGTTGTRWLLFPGSRQRVHLESLLLTCVIGSKPHCMLKMCPMPKYNAFCPPSPKSRHVTLLAVESHPTFRDIYPDFYCSVLSLSGVEEIDADLR